MEMAAGRAAKGDIMSIGFHGQRPITYWLDAIKILPAGAPFLAVDDVHMLRDAKLANPGILTIFRKKIDVQHFATNFEDAKQLARDYFNTFIDGTWPAAKTRPSGS